MTLISFVTKMLKKFVSSIDFAQFHSKTHLTKNTVIFHIPQLSQSPSQYQYFRKKAFHILHLYTSKAMSVVLTCFSHEMAE